MPDLPCRGGGVNPTSMAQNDTHVALIILTTQMWGGGDYWWKKLFRAKNFVFLRLQRQHPFLHKTKGPTRNPISPTPPPLLWGASMSSPRSAIFRSPKGCGLDPDPRQKRRAHCARVRPRRSRTPGPRGMRRGQGTNPQQAPPPHARAWLDHQAPAQAHEGAWRSRGGFAGGHGGKWLARGWGGGGHLSPSKEGGGGSG